MSTESASKSQDEPSSGMRSTGNCFLSHCRARAMWPAKKGMASNHCGSTNMRSKPTASIRPTRFVGKASMRSFGALSGRCCLSGWRDRRDLCGAFQPLLVAHFKASRDTRVDAPSVIRPCRPWVVALRLLRSVFSVARGGSCIIAAQKSADFRMISSIDFMDACGPWPESSTSAGMSSSSIDPARWKDRPRDSNCLTTVSCVGAGVIQLIWCHKDLRRIWPHQGSMKLTPKPFVVAFMLESPFICSLAVSPLQLLLRLDPRRR